MSDSARNVLLLSKNFVPQVGGGVRRVHAISQILPQHAYSVFSVASSGKPDLLYRSSSDRLRQLARQLKLGRIYRKAARWLSVPDEGVIDIPDLILRTRHTNPDLILASGPPNSILLAAQALSKSLGCPWVADLRDPWIDHPQNAPPSALHASAQAYLENYCLQTASGVVVATQAMADAIGNRIRSDIPVHTFFNGYNASQLLDVSPQKKDQPTVGYFGSFYGPITPLPLVKAVAGANAVLIHAGADYDKQLQQAADKHGVSVQSLGLLSPEQSFAQMHEVDILAMVLPDDPSWAYCRTQKLAEYLATRRPILAFIPAGEASELIKKHDAGISVPHTDTKTAIEAIHTLSKRDVTNRKPPVDLSWESQIEKLARFLDQIS